RDKVRIVADAPLSTAFDKAFIKIDQRSHLVFVTIVAKAFVQSAPKARRIDAAVPQVAQCLPEGTATPGFLRDGQKARGLGVPRLDPMAQGLLENGVIGQRCARPGLDLLGEPEIELVKGQNIDIEKIHSIFSCKANF